MRDALTTVGSLGFELPSVWYIVGSLLFSTIGLFVFRIGRRTKSTYLTCLGAVLIGYTYAIYNTFYVYAIGVGLCVSVWFAHISHDEDD